MRLRSTRNNQHKGRRVLVVGDRRADDIHDSPLFYLALTLVQSVEEYSPSQGACVNAITSERGGEESLEPFLDRFVQEARVYGQPFFEVLAVG